MYARKSYATKDILGTIVQVRWIDGEIILDLETASSARLRVHNHSFCPNLEGFLEVIGVHAHLAPASVRQITANCVNGCPCACLFYPDACRRKHYLDRFMA